jgi:cell filamentation protein
VGYVYNRPSTSRISSVSFASPAFLNSSGTPKVCFGPCQLEWQASTRLHDQGSWSRVPAMPSRYKASGIQSEFEPGSKGRVLRNLLGISRLRDMQQAESQALQLAQRQAIESFSATHRFTAKDVKTLHRLWLGPIYVWAGDYRTVNVSRRGFHFAAARLIPDLMKSFESNELAPYTPCRPGTDRDVARALAVVHAELVLIHPFRDGNGRVARLLAMLMGLQAGLPPLDFSPLDGRGRHAYVAGIQAALDREYETLSGLFEKVIVRTRRRASSSSPRRPSRS